MSGSQKGKMRSQSQPDLQSQADNAYLAKFVNKDSTLLDISQIPYVEELKGVVEDPYVNESREHYEEALVQLTQGKQAAQKDSKPVGDTIKVDKSSSMFKANSKRGRKLSKDIQKKFESTMSNTNMKNLTARASVANQKSPGNKEEKPNTETKLQVSRTCVECMANLYRERKCSSSKRKSTFKRVLTRSQCQ